jgi:REP element-mobilizing transposase RayT
MCKASLEALGGRLLCCKNSCARAIASSGLGQNDAIAILPNHIHCIWTLPENDADFSTRWRLIKSYFSRECHVSYQEKMTSSRKQKGEKAIWQRRFWEL